MKNAVLWDVALCACEEPRDTRSHKPEDGILHSHRRENPKSYIFNMIHFYIG
jgi:hypothetical protein